MPPSDSVNPASPLVRESVKRTLVRMALPMLAGTFAMNAYNLTDTWFVSRLGKIPLAAMGFTFPVVMLLHCFVAGLGMGVTALVSHALGDGDRDRAARYTVHGLLLVAVVTLAITAVAFLKMDAIFKLLGADEVVLPLIRGYMVIWFAGSLFAVMPRAGSGILISCGDSKAASRLMVMGTLLNLVLDPIMIFGFLGFPAMGIRGAALATVLSRAVATIFLFRALIRKHQLIRLRAGVMAEWGHSLARIARLGVPCILSMMLMPASGSIMIRIISQYGHEAVAAAGAAGRIEMFAFVIPMALGISMAPFVSQNLGAGRLDRIHESVRLSCGFALLYGAVVAGLFYLFAPTMAAAFTDDPEVLRVLVAYIRIISFGYGMMEIHRYSGIILTGLHKPTSSMILNAIRVFALILPLALLGSHLAGLRGVFWGRLASDILAGIIGFAWAITACRRQADALEE